MLRWLRKSLRSIGILNRAPASIGRVLNLNPDDLLMRSNLHTLMEVMGPHSQPNINALRQLANSIEPLSLNIKQMGYSLARQLAAALPPSGPTEARMVGMKGSISTQAAIESDWAAHWCAELKIPVVFHRKVWEYCFVMQCLYEADMLQPGRRGLGFGCGEEPTPSYFASKGIDVTATDLPPEMAAGTGWVDTGQHMSALDKVYHGHLCERDLFDRHVSLEYVDMNAIPATLRGYDFCWSICALEHLGSIEKGLAFIENTLETLRPGGVSVHTTEFNIRDDGPTIDNWSSVAFQRKHMEAISERLRAKGHIVTPFDYALGDKPLDKFVDLPPWPHDLPPDMRAWLGEGLHLKLAFDGVIVTCIGLKVEKGPEPAA